MIYNLSSSANFLDLICYNILTINTIIINELKIGLKFILSGKTFL